MLSPVPKRNVPIESYVTNSNFHLHLVSDATGETVQSVARACLVQFEEATPTEHIWTLVRNERQIDEVIHAIEANPGFVLFTMVNVIYRDTPSSCVSASSGSVYLGFTTYYVCLSAFSPD